MNTFTVAYWYLKHLQCHENSRIIGQVVNCDGKIYFIVFLQRQHSKKLIPRLAQSGAPLKLSLLEISRWPRLRMRFLQVIVECRCCAHAKAMLCEICLKAVLAYAHTRAYAVPSSKRTHGLGRTFTVVPNLASHMRPYIRPGHVISCPISDVVYWPQRFGGGTSHD